MPIKIKPLHWTQEAENTITARTFGGTMSIHRLENWDFEAVFNSAIRLGYDRWLGKSASAVVTSSYCDKEHARRIQPLLEKYTYREKVKPLVWEACDFESVREWHAKQANTFGGHFFVREFEDGTFRTTFCSNIHPKYNKVLYWGKDKREAHAFAARSHQQKVKKFLEPYVEGL